MGSLLFLLLFIPTFALAQTLPPPKILKEQSGNVTNYYAEGNLASIQAVGCIPLKEAKNTFTPPDLYKGFEECLAKDNYDLAVGLFALAGIYSSFDAERITDETAGQGGTVLIMNTFATVGEEKKSKFSGTLNRVATNPEALGKLCGEVQKIGAPNYYPSYMILHGVKAFMGNPHEGALVQGFDAPGVWKKLQSEYLHCPQ